MRKQGYNFLIEHIRGISGDEARYGIAILQPERGIKKCKIRKLTVEYLLSNAEIVLICPKSCCGCGRKDVCMDEFVLQIIEKYNDKTQRSNSHLI
jgi:hypothetical protein